MKRLLLSLCMWCLCHAAREDVPEYYKKGNFSLSTSQQPSPLFAFGQNIVDKHDVVGYGAMYYLKGKDKKFVDIWPEILYGVRDDLSLYFVAPCTPKNHVGSRKSSGVEDVFIQAEYLFYSRDLKKAAVQATAVGALFFPTGSVKKDPFLGTGGLGFLLGTTVSYTSIDWYCFISPFAFLTTPHHTTQFGNQFFYQAGVGKNIVGKPDKVIVTLIAELYGAYSQRDKIRGVINANSGGNLVYAGPEIYIGTKQLIAQAGFLYVIGQHIYGHQNKDQYLLSVSLGWKFNS